MSRRFVLLDRDGTVIVQKHHLRSIEDMELIPGAAEGIRLLNEAGLGVVIVTNQSVVGRGLLTPEGLDDIHRELVSRLADQGAQLEGIYVCPHTPDENCICRKPLPELALRAAREWEFDLRHAHVIGDQASDVKLGRACGANSVLVRTGYGAGEESNCLGADWVADDLLAAAERIIAMSGLVSDAAQRLRRHVEISIETKRQLLEGESAGLILDAALRIAQSLEQGGKVLLCGNGGSAADAQHIAAEFVSVLTQDFLRPGLAAIALTTDTSVLTASANDFGFSGIFARQVQALGRPGDVLIGISTSGNSENVVKAVECARSRGIHTIVLTGQGGGKLAAAADIAIRVPSATTQFIQESHIMIGHILCELSERSLTYTESDPIIRAKQNA